MNQSIAPVTVTNCGLVDEERSVLLLAELLGLTDRVLELFDCIHLKAVQRVFRHVAPDRRRISRIVDSPQ